MGIFEIIGVLLIFLAVLFFPGWWARRKRKRLESRENTAKSKQP